MRSKVLALTLLMILLLAPLTQIVYAEETGGEGTEGGTEGTEEETGEEEESGNIDPLVFEQIKQNTETMYQELYNMIFGQASAEGEGTEGEGTEGEGTEGEGEGEEDPELAGYDGPEIPLDTDPALRNQFMHAWMAMQQAQNMEAENPQTAAQQYLRAMKQLRNAWRKYQMNNPEIVEETESGEETGEGDEEPTEEEITEIQEMLIERFADDIFKEELRRLYINFNEVQGELSPGDAVKVQDALYHAEQKLLRIQNRIEDGQYDEALDELDEATEGLDEELGELEDPGSAQMWKTVNQLEARIAKMKERMERKAAQGEDTSGDEELLGQLRGSVNNAKNEHKENKGQSQSQGSNNGNHGKPDKPDKPNKNEG